MEEKMTPQEIREAIVGLQYRVSQLERQVKELQTAAKLVAHPTLP